MDRLCKRTYTMKRLNTTRSGALVVSNLTYEITTQTVSSLEILRIIDRKGEQSLAVSVQQYRAAASILECQNSLRGHRSIPRTK